MEHQLIGIRAGMHAEVHLEVLDFAAFRELLRVGPVKADHPNDLVDVVQAAQAAQVYVVDLELRIEPAYVVRKTRRVRVGRDHLLVCKHPGAKTAPADQELKPQKVNSTKSSWPPQSRHT